MDLCIDCQYRAGVTCTHPYRLANGGPGLHIDAAPDMPAHARGYGFFTTYAYPPRVCRTIGERQERQGRGLNLHMLIADS